jgi:hypothetical protein
MSDTLFWISFGFAVFFAAFLVYAFVYMKSMTESQWQILRLLSSLCMGFAGGLFTGSVIFTADFTTSLGKFGISAVGGFAAWAIIWFSFGKLIPEPENEQNFSLPAVSFEKAAKILAKSYRFTISFVGFSEDELSAKLEPYELKTKTPREMFLALRNITKQRGAVREYDVSNDGTAYQLKIKE